MMPVDIGPIAERATAEGTEISIISRGHHPVWNDSKMFPRRATFMMMRRDLGMARCAG
jgi:hypothetical protein